MRSFDVAVQDPACLQTYVCMTQPRAESIIVRMVEVRRQITRLQDPHTCSIIVTMLLILHGGFQKMGGAFLGVLHDYNSDHSIGVCFGARYLRKHHMDRFKYLEVQGTYNWVVNLLVRHSEPT